MFVPFASEYRDPVKFGNSQSEVLRYYDPHSASQQMALGAAPDVLARVRREGEAESMRLLYVAITRASHRCYLGVGEDKLSDQSALGQIMRRADFDDWRRAIEALIQEGDGHTALISEVAEETLPAAQIDAVKLRCATFERALEDNWRLYSFSAITRQAVHTTFRHREAEAVATDNNTLPVTAKSEALRFQLKAGAQSGNLLHDILEVTDFSAPDWAETGAAVARRYGIDEADHDALFSWLDEVLTTPLELAGAGPVKLADLAMADTLREAEFYFPLHQADRRAVGRILQQHRHSQGGEALPAVLDGVRLEGMMHGFIDLIFCVDGRYFVADYKSTMLGDSPEDYQPHKLNQNNQQHYYDLQYLIYSVALHRFLAQRIEDYEPDIHFGGVAYFYLRGMSGDFPPGSGVFFHPLSADLIAEMEQALTGKVMQEAL